jgi:hypothetical protein
MAHRQPFKPILPGTTDIDSRLDPSDISPHPGAAVNDKTPINPIDTTAPILNLSGLKKASLKKADAMEHESNPTSPEHLAPNPLSSAIPNATHYETFQASNLAQRGAPAFAMPFPLKLAAQQSPAFVSTINPPLRTPSRAETTRKTVQSEFLISNSAATRFVPTNADSIPFLRPSSAASAAHIDRAGFSRFTRHSGGVKMATNAPFANPSISQRGSHLQNTSHEYPEHPVHSLSAQDNQEQVPISEGDENDVESKLTRESHFVRAGKHGLDEDNRHEGDSGVVASENRKRQRLYDVSSGFVGAHFLGALSGLTAHVYLT